jgi:enterochelin esterase-like enzyme
MHRPLTFLSCSLLLAALPAQAPALKNFTVETGTLKSDKVRQGDAGYTIFLPKEYGDAANKDVKYPWALWLPGFGGTNEFVDGGGAAVLDRLRGEGKIPPMAFVVFKSPRGRSVYMNGETASDTEDLVVIDLPAQLEQKYRLGGDKKQRALMGVSAGGFGALKLALRHPDVFGVVAAHSSAILPADPEELGGMLEQRVTSMLRQPGIAKELGDPIDKAKWQAHMPLAIVAAKKPDELKGLQIYFDAGTDDRYQFLPPNEQLDKAMTAAGHKHLFRKVEGGGHAFGDDSMKDNVACSLQFVGAAFAGKDAVATMSASDKKDAKKEEPKPVEKGSEKPAEKGEQPK